MAGVSLAGPRDAVHPTVPGCEAHAGHAVSLHDIISPPTKQNGERKSAFQPSPALSASVLQVFDPRN